MDKAVMGIRLGGLRRPQPVGQSATDLRYHAVQPLTPAVSTAAGVAGAGMTTTDMTATTTAAAAAIAATADIPAAAAVVTTVVAAVVVIAISADRAADNA